MFFIDTLISNMSPQFVFSTEVVLAPASRMCLPMTGRYGDLKYIQLYL